jgi:hypothetical protein
LPDAECRRRLVRLYGQGLTLELTRPDALIDRTQGVSAAFMRELLRRAAALAAEDGAPIVVRDRHIDDALRDLLVAGGEVLRNLFGVAKA